MTRWVQRQPRARRGAVMIEFIIAFPLLMLFLLATLEFGLAFNDQHLVTSACFDGARSVCVGEAVADIKHDMIQKLPSSLRLGLRPEAIHIYYQAPKLGDAAKGWEPETELKEGMPNNVPQKSQIRVQVDQFPHTLVTGSFFHWLPIYRTWDFDQGVAKPGGVPVFLFAATGGDYH